MKLLKSSTKVCLSVFLFVVLLLVAIPHGECMGSKGKIVTVKVGAIIPLTGPISFIGDLIKEGMELAVEEVNEKSAENGFRLEIVYGDNKGAPKHTISTIQRNINIDEIKLFLVAPTPACMAVTAIVDKAKVIMFAGSTHPYITDKSEYIFRTCASNAEENNLLIKYAESNGIESVGALFVEDDFGLSAISYFQEHFNGRVIIQEAYDRRNTEFRPQILKIRHAEPEAVLIQGYGIAIPTILKQMAELGVDRPILGNLGFVHPPVVRALKNLPADFVKRMTFSSPVFSQKFTHLIENKFSMKPDLAQAYGYDFIIIIAREIKKHGLDVDKIKKSILQIKNYSGAFEKISFSPNGDSRSTVRLMKVEKGEIVPLDSIYQK